MAQWNATVHGKYSLNLVHYVKQKGRITLKNYTVEWIGSARASDSGSTYLYITVVAEMGMLPTKLRFFKSLSGPL